MGIECSCGLLMIAPLTLYAPISALVTQLVPPGRVGEAMGAVAACKNIASLIAPLIMGVILEKLAASGRNDLYWTIFPGGALLMLLTAWPFSLMLARVPQDEELS